MHRLHYIEECLDFNQMNTIQSLVEWMKTYYTIEYLN